MGFRDDSGVVLNKPELRTCLNGRTTFAHVMTTFAHLRTTFAHVRTTSVVLTEHPVRNFREFLTHHECQEANRGLQFEF